VKLIVEIIEPYQGRIYDPACGSGGMFVQSAQFVARHHKDPTAIFVCGQEKTRDTVKLGRMNLAVHGLSGDIREANSFYDDVHGCVDAFDFVMANPPFNVSGVDKSRIKSDIGRYPMGMPNTDNANYIWMQLFHASLNAQGRAGFVMANSAGDARSSELEIRKKLIESDTVDVMVSVGSNFFYTVTLPCTLWFFDKTKPKTVRKGTVLFLDARHIYRQIDRAHREWTDQQIEFLANIVRLYRGVPVETDRCSSALLTKHFPDSVYQDVAGLCKVATLSDIEAQGWSLNPGRYVGVTAKVADEFVFAERLEELNEELEMLNAGARELEERIGENIAKILETVQ
ncbi:MAG: SAM-dependent DNA methyltransferase, partial [Proteobacteria bacterium]